MNVDKILDKAIDDLEKSIKKIRATTLDVRQLPDKVGYGDPAISADQLDRESDNLEKVRDLLVTGRGTGRNKPVLQ